MKKVINYFSTQFICKMILMILAVVTGGGAMAVADLVEPQIGDEGPNPASDATVKATEPVEAVSSYCILAPFLSVEGGAENGFAVSIVVKMQRGSILGMGLCGAQADLADAALL